MIRRLKEATKMSSLEALCEMINKKMPPKDGEYFIENIGYGSGKYRLSVLYPENGGVGPVSPAMTKRELESALQTVVDVWRRSFR